MKRDDVGNGTDTAFGFGRGRTSRLPDERAGTLAASSNPSIT